TIKSAFPMLVLRILLISCPQSTGNANNPASRTKDSLTVPEEETQIETERSLHPQLDSLKFRELNQDLANGDTTGKWPAVGVPIPLPGAILPFKRIIAYYGNIYSKRMGALGEYAPEEMWNRLDKEVKKWNEADT